MTTTTTENCKGSDSGKSPAGRPGIFVRRKRQRPFPTGRLRPAAALVVAKSALLRFRQPGGENSARSLAPPRPTQTALLGLRGDPIDCHAHVAAKNGFHLFRACGRELCEAFATALNPGSPADGRDFLRAEGVFSPQELSRARASPAARAIRSRSSGRSRKCSKASTAWCSSMGRPLQTRSPRALAWASSWVSAGW